MRGRMISNNRHKQTLVRGPTPQNSTAHGVVRVPYPSYGPSTSTQSQYMEFIPTPGLPKQ